MCQQKLNGWSAMNIEKELKSRIWHSLYTAVQREKIHHLWFMKILVTRKVIAIEGQEYMVSPHHGMAKISVSLYWFHIHQASILIIHLESWYKCWYTIEGVNDGYVACVGEVIISSLKVWQHDNIYFVTNISTV